MRISVIVPVYNEAAIAAVFGERLSALDFPETIIVDGGSTDGTWERLKQLKSPAVRVYQTAAGRARQMNHGALKATGDVLLFLHADTRLPGRAPDLIERALRRRPGHAWGRFDVRFDHDGLLLAYVARAMNLRSAWTSICTGDQAIFVERPVFLAAGGFAPIDLMEDIDLSRRLKRRARAARIREPVVTSARRWRSHGVWRTIGLMWRLRWLYWWGTPTWKLAGRYRRCDGSRADTFRQDPPRRSGKDAADP